MADDEPTHQKHVGLKNMPLSSRVSLCHPTTSVAGPAWVADVIVRILPNAKHTIFLLAFGGTAKPLDSIF